MADELAPRERKPAVEIPGVPTMKQMRSVIRIVTLAERLGPTELLYLKAKFDELFARKLQVGDRTEAQTTGE